MSVIRIVRLHQQLRREADGSLRVSEFIDRVVDGLVSVAGGDTPVSDIEAGYALMDAHRAEMFPEVAT